MDNKQIDKVTFVSSLPSFIIGAEGEEPPAPAPKPTPPADPPAPKVEEPKSEEKPKHEDADDPAVQGLKSALEAERNRAKANEKELKQLQKEKEERELADKTELEKLQITSKKDKEKAEKLATGYRNRIIGDAIKSAATDFIDSIDAIEGVDWSEISYEQDEDDPSVVTVDQKSVEAAVKKLMDAGAKAELK